MKRALLCLSVDAVGASLLPWVIHDAGFETDLVGSPRLAAGKSRFVRDRIPTDMNGPAAREGLERQLAANPERYAFVVTDEPTLRTFVDRLATPASARLLPIVADTQRFARLVSKIDFTVDAAEAGVAVPSFRLLGDARELEAERWTGTPFVVKAAESMAGSGVRLVRSADDLSAAKTSGLQGSLIVQEFIEGRLGATAVLFRRGVPQCWYSYWLLRNWPNALAASSAFELYWDPQIEPMLEKIGAFTQFDGLCGIDWMRNAANGRIELIEMNIRPTPGLYLGKYAGVSFPKAIAAWAGNRELVQRPAQMSGPVLRLWPQNLYPSVERREPLEFVRTFSDAPWADPMLMATHFRRMVTHHLPSGLRSGLRRALRPQG